MSLNKLRVLPVAFSCFVVSAVQLGAQTPATCTVAPTSVTSLSIESVLTLSNVMSTLAPNIPADVLAGISSGAQEIRSRLIYNPTANTITNTVFQVAPGSPNPTPLFVNVDPSTLIAYTLGVDKVYTSCKPVPNVLFVGTISGSGGSFGNFTGAPAAISIGYTTGATPNVNNVVEVIAGTVVAYAASARGSVVFPAAPVTPGGGANAAPTIVVGPGVSTSTVNQVFINPITIDVTGSTDPNKLPLTFAFTSNKAVDFKPSATSGTPTLYFQAGAGDYQITVVATNSAGVSSAPQVINFQYLGQF